MSAVDIGRVAGRIVETDAAAAAEAQRLLDTKTKPPRSLGRLEDLVCQLAAIRGYATPRVRPAKAIVVMGADHGVAAEGVSAYPQDVTGQMLLNFASGGAAINVLARQAGARVVVVDMGVARPLPPTPEIRACRIGAGTANLARGPAMTRAQARAALAAGARWPTSWRATASACSASARWASPTRPRPARSPPCSRAPRPRRSRAAAPASTTRRFGARSTSSAGASRSTGRTQTTPSTRSPRWAASRSPA